MNDHTSKNFDLELESLRTRVLQMGGLAAQQVRRAIDGLYSGDTPLLEAVIRDDDRVNQMEIEIDALCNQVIAKRQPTAIDLRMIVSVLKAISDIERVGDKARKIARLGISISSQSGLCSFSSAGRRASAPWVVSPLMLALMRVCSPPCCCHFSLSRAGQLCSACIW